MSVPSSDSKPRDTQPNDEVKAPDNWILWPLLLPLILGAGVVLMQVQPFPTTIEETTEATPFMRVRPRPLATPKVQPTPIPTIQYSIPATIWVVGDDAQLHQKPFKNNVPANGGANLAAIRTAWINAVIAAESTMFPPGTRVQSVQVGNDAEPATVDFNAAFNTPNFWSGETKTRLAIYSIVNTLAPVMSPKGRDVPVQITVDGKRLQTLGEFDVSDPIAPDYSLNSSSQNAAQSAVENPAPSSGSSLP